MSTSSWYEKISKAAAQKDFSKPFGPTMPKTKTPQMSHQMAVDYIENRLHYLREHGFETGIGTDGGNARHPNGLGATVILHFDGCSWKPRGVISLGGTSYSPKEAAEMANLLSGLAGAVEAIVNHLSRYNIHANGQR